MNVEEKADEFEIKEEDSWEIISPVKLSSRLQLRLKNFSIAVDVFPFEDEEFVETEESEMYTESNESDEESCHENYDTYHTPTTNPTRIALHDGEDRGFDRPTLKAFTALIDPFPPSVKGSNRSQQFTAESYTTEDSAFSFSNTENVPASVSIAANRREVENELIFRAFSMNPAQFPPQLLPRSQAPGMIKYEERPQMILKKFSITPGLFPSLSPRIKDVQNDISRKEALLLHRFTMNPTVLPSFTRKDKVSLGSGLKLTSFDVDVRKFPEEVCLTACSLENFKVHPGVFPEHGNGSEKTWNDMKCNLQLISFVANPNTFPDTIVKSFPTDDSKIALFTLKPFNVDITKFPSIEV